MQATPVQALSGGAEARKEGAGAGPQGPSPVENPVSRQRPPAASPKARWRSPGLQARILFLMVFALVLLALVSSFATAAFLEGQMMRDARSRGDAIAESLAAAAASLIAAQGPAAVDRLLEPFGTMDRVAYVVVYDNLGTPIASTFDTLPAALQAAPQNSTGRATPLVMVPSGGQGPLFTALDLVAANPLATVRVGVNRDEIITQLQRNSVDLMVIQGMVVLVALLAAILFSARLVRPIRALVRAARAVGQGDLSHEVRTSSRDEVGLLAQTFNDTVRRLRGLVVTEAERDEERSRRETLQSNIRDFLMVTQQIAQGDLRSRGRVTADVLGNVVDSINVMVEEIGETLQGVRESALSVSGSADEVIEATEQIASRVQNQLTAAREVSDGVISFGQSVREVSETAAASSGTARKTQEAAQTGQRAVRETLESMDRIREEVKGISRRIKALGDRSLEISEIVETISYISSQTNLLALNAAIEASGAGEHGARFAVGADEVRRLAEEASSSSRNIGRLIKTVQAEINEVVGAMEQGTEEVQTGFLLARQAEGHLEEISQISEASSKLAERISTETVGQVESMGKVAQSVDTIRELAESTDSTVLSGKHTAESVRDLAQQLMVRLSRFQLPKAG